MKEVDVQTLDVGIDFKLGFSLGVLLGSSSDPLYAIICKPRNDDEWGPANFWDVPWYGGDLDEVREMHTKIVQAAYQNYWEVKQFKIVTLKK